MTRQQLITAGVVMLVLAGVWLSSREPTSRQAKPTEVPQPLIAISSTTDLPTTTAGPILLTAPASPTVATSDALPLLPNVVTPAAITPSSQPTGVIVAPPIIAPTVVEIAPTAATPTFADQPTPISNLQSPDSNSPPPPTTTHPSPPPSPDIAAAEQSLIDQVNYQRARAGMPPYARSEILMEIARWRVNDMVARGYFGHNDPTTGEPACRSRATQAGFSRAGENIYGSSVDLSVFPLEAVGWYMTDAPHRENILHPVYTSIGVGIARRGGSWISAMCLGG